MSTNLVPKSMLARLRLPALAAALAVAASASHAGAVVNITSFIITTDGVPFVAPKFAEAAGQTSDLSMQASSAGVVTGTDSQFYSATDWNDGPNVIAQVGAAVALGNVISRTDPLTQLQTGSFSLSSLAWLQQGISSTASAMGGLSGGFSLLGLDANGFDLVPVAGSLTFDIFYDLIVTNEPGATPLNSSDEALIAFSAADNDGGDSLSDMRNSAGTTSGQFTMTFDLGAGEMALFSLAGSAVSAAALPEPGSMALAMVGLLAAGASVRRPRRQA